MPKSFPFLLALCLLFLPACKDEHVPPADLITPDEDSAELIDPMNPGAFNGETDEQGLTKEDPLPEVKGDGSSISSPAIITGVFSRLGKMEAESDHISARLGKEGEAWSVKTTFLQTSGNRSIEVVTVSTSSGAVQNFYFDITEYENSWQ